MALAATAGAMLPLQGALNARLAAFLGSPFWAAAVSGLLLTVVLACFALASAGVPRFAGSGPPPWWAWAGGLCGVVVLTGVTTVSPRLGAAAMIGFLVAGQVFCALLLDHFGLFGLVSQPIDLKRLVGAALLVAGVALVR